MDLFLKIWIALSLLPTFAFIYYKIYEKKCQHCFHSPEYPTHRVCCQCNRHERRVTVPLAHGPYMSLGELGKLDESDVDHKWVKYSEFSY